MLGARQGRALDAIMFENTNEWALHRARRRLVEANVSHSLPAHTDVWRLRAPWTDAQRSSAPSPAVPSPTTVGGTTHVDDAAFCIVDELAENVLTKTDLALSIICFEMAALVEVNLPPGKSEVILGLQGAQLPFRFAHQASCSWLDHASDRNLLVLMRRG